MSKWSWKKFIKAKIKAAALITLTEENSSKEKTKDIVFEQLKMSDYLAVNENTSLSRIIFSIRSKTLDIKEWQPWKYTDNLCVQCEKVPETMDHFVTCVEYGIEQKTEWKDMIKSDTSRQVEIAKFVAKRFKIREEKIEKDGHS